jgi:hypothetical protein
MIQTAQQEIDFNISHRENNPESQAHFEANKDKFSKQCRIVYEALLRGERLTTKIAMKDYDIGHLPRRILDLKEKGVSIDSVFIEGNYKEYFLVKSAA